MSPANDGAEDLLGGFICRVNFEIFEEPASERQAPCVASVSFSSTTSWRAGHVAGVPVLIPVAPRQLGPSFFRLASI